MKLDALSCRKMAWKQLQGKWGNASLTGLVASLMGVFTGFFNGVLKLVIFSYLIIRFCEGVPFYRGLTFICLLILACMWAYVGSFVKLGYIDYNLSILDQRESSTGLLFGTSTLWWNSLYLQIILILGTVIGTMFFVIPGILFYLNYAMAPFLLEEMNGVSVAEAMNLSKTGMKGYRGEFFILKLSFIGWHILGIVTLGIAYLWVHPYQSLAETVFFNEISGRAKALYGRER